MLTNIRAFRHQPRRTPGMLVLIARSPGTVRQRITVFVHSRRLRLALNRRMRLRRGICRVIAQGRIRRRRRLRCSLRRIGCLHPRQAVNMRLLRLLPRRSFFRLLGSPLCSFLGRPLCGLLGRPFLCGLFRSLSRRLLLCLPGGLFCRSFSSVFCSLRLQCGPLRGQLLGSLFRGQPRGLQLCLLCGPLRGQLLGGLLRGQLCGLFCFFLGCLLGCKLCGPPGNLLGRLFGRLARCLFRRLTRRIFGCPPRFLCCCKPRCRFCGSTCSLFCRLPRRFFPRYARCLVCRLARRQLGSLVRSLLRCQFRNACFFFRAGLFRHATHFGRTLHISQVLNLRRLFSRGQLPCARLFFVYGLLHAQPRLFPGLRARC